MECGNAAAKKIRAITGNKQVSTMRVDMSSMADINRFAKDFKLQLEGRLDVLINNAGITGIMNIYKKNVWQYMVKPINVFTEYLSLFFHILKILFCCFGVQFQFDDIVLINVH